MPGCGSASPNPCLSVSTAAASTCCRRGSDCSLHCCWSRWGWRAQLQQQPGLAAVPAPGRRRQHQPARGAPQLSGLTIGAIVPSRCRRDATGRARARARTAGRVRRGLRVDCDDTMGALSRTRAWAQPRWRSRPSSAAGWTLSGCAFPPHARSVSPARGLTSGRRRRCWCIPLLNRMGRHCRRDPATAPSRACIPPATTSTTCAPIAAATRAARSPGSPRHGAMPCSCANTSTLGADVLLDWRQLAALDYEPRIRRLAYWVDQAEREGRRYCLQLPGQPALGPASGALHRHACLRALALMPHVR